MAVPTSVFFNNRFVHRFAAPCLALGLSVFAEAVAAVDLSKIESAAGPWEIALLNTERRCGMQLRTDRVQSGHMVGMPAGCRRAGCTPTPDGPAPCASEGPSTSVRRTRRGSGRRDRDPQPLDKSVALEFRPQH